jgi:hypothetical protein
MLGLLAEATGETHRDWSDAATETMGGSVLAEEDKVQMLGWIQTLTAEEAETLFDTGEQEIERRYQEQLSQLQSSFEIREKEGEQAYQEKLQKLEQDYQSATNRVKALEKIVAMHSGQVTNGPFMAPPSYSRARPPNRNHDLELATEISRSLLAQVRSLQRELAERDKAIEEVRYRSARHGA